MSRAFAGILAGNGGGAILNILSVASWVNRPILSGYGVSKSAAWALTSCVIRCASSTKVVHAGFIDTDLTAGLDVPKATPADVVRQACKRSKGEEEVSTDEFTRQVKATLSSAFIWKNRRALTPPVPQNLPPALLGQHGRRPTRQTVVSMMPGSSRPGSRPRRSRRRRSRSRTAAGTRSCSR